MIKGMVESLLDKLTANKQSTDFKRLQQKAANAGLIKMSKGGLVKGKGNRDTVNALLTPGELVIPKKHVSAVKKFLKSEKVKLPGMK